MSENKVVEPPKGRSTSLASIGVAGKPVVGWLGETETRLVCWWAVTRVDVEKERGRGLPPDY